jgi:predicted nucleic acid-binding protein
VTGKGGPVGSGLVLIDKSAWEQMSHHPGAQRRITELVLADRVATCLLATLEGLYSARNADSFDALRAALARRRWLPTTPEVEAAAIEIMAQLAASGHHRVPLPDLIIAACAWVHGAHLLHYDSDFERIAAVTGQSQEWVIARGSGHGRQRTR